MKKILFLFSLILLCTSLSNPATINVPAQYSTLQAAVNAAVNGDEILIAAGTYIEPVQVDITKNITILGQSAATTILKPGFNTTAGGNVKSESFIYIDPLATVVMKNLTIDCAGQLVNHAIQSRGALDIQDCIITNVKWGTYNGRGIVFFGGTTNNFVNNVSINNVERIGIHVRGNVMVPNPVVNIQNFTYTGKGPGDWLDYGIEFGGGGAGLVDNANISNCEGIASDGSTSAGILVTDYWGTGTNATIINSDINSNTTGIYVGYNELDQSVVTANNNNLAGNSLGMIATDLTTVNAENNWWGTSVLSEIQALIEGPVDFTPWIAGDYNVYLSSSTSATVSTIYPNDSWGDTPYEPAPPATGDDWDFTAPVSFYIVPEFGAEFGASNITVQWDNTMFSYSGVDKTGGIYDDPEYQFIYSQLGTTNSVTINAARTDNDNFSIEADDYIAKLNLNLLKPGFGPISFTALDFRFFDGLGGYLGVFMTGNNAEVKSYLGDVASSTSTSTGDGLVDFEDLVWAGSYWSGVGGNGLTNYKVKYDVGPTTTNTVYGNPLPDTKIQFEDLVIFSISYGLSASGVYPKIEAEPTTPVELQLGEPIIAGRQTRIPLYVSGGVQNVRAMSLTFSGQFGKLISVEKSTLLSSFENPVMVMSNVDGSQVFVDLAVCGAEEVGINTEGEVLTLVFEGNTEINISNAEVRNIANGPMAVNTSGSEGSVPTEFALMQNYPNPFNPTTTINYNLPMQSIVEISIYNALGEKVAMLVNEIKEAGRHNVEFNASGYSSGIYFYQIKANDYVSVKKMILMK